MNTLLHRALYVFLALLMAGLIAPRRASAAAGRDYWVYFGSYTGGRSKGIYMSRLDTSGHLTEPELAATTANPTFLAVDPRHQYLYAANEINEFHGQKAGSVTAYAFDGVTGKLTELNQQSSGGQGPCHVSVDFSGKTVMVANYVGGSVEALPVQPDGSLGAPTSFIQHTGSSVNPTRQAGPHAHCIIPAPSNKFALVCDLGLDKVLVYKLNAKRGTLTPNDSPFATVKSGEGPRHLAFHTFGKYVYVLNEMGCTVTVFAYDQKKGTLSELQDLSTLPEGQEKKPNFTCAEIMVHPTGRFLYASIRGHNSISVFHIDGRSGMLTLVDNTPTAGRTPRNFSIDPTGRFLLAANQDSGNVVVFNIDPDTGRLTPTGQQLEIGSPVAIVFMPVQ